PRRRHTKRLADAVAWACREERSVQGVADQFDLGWDLVKDIDKEALKHSSRKIQRKHSGLPI
ncbi:MAG TPA: transposase family protein, partial [Planctomycetota bacterium]|nr:transposase family protein [Planctomycetota bacterium]